MLSPARAALRRAVPLHGTPRRWRHLVAAEALFVAALVLVTIVVAAAGHGTLVEPLYGVLLPVALFYAPPVAAAACAALDGGLLPSLALGAVPALVWTVAVVVGHAVRALFSIPATPADSPLWALSAAFLAFGLSGALAGFLLGRGGLLAWRRLRS